MENVCGNMYWGNMLENSWGEPFATRMVSEHFWLICLREGTAKHAFPVGGTLFRSPCDISGWGTTLCRLLHPFNPGLDCSVGDSSALYELKGESGGSAKRDDNN